MGGLREDTDRFFTYSAGMLALSGFPIFFSGFWSKDAIIGAAHNWPISKGPFVLLILGALCCLPLSRQIAIASFDLMEAGVDLLIPTRMETACNVLPHPSCCSRSSGFLSGTPAWP